MKKFFSLFLFLAAVPCFGQTWSPLPADYIINMNTSTPGTLLNTSIVAAGFVSSSMTETAGVGTGFTVGANQQECSNLGPIQMNGTGGTLFSAQGGGTGLPLNANNIAIDDGQTLQNVTLNGLGSANGKGVISALICIHEGPPSTGGSGSDFDRYGLWAGGVNGEYSMLQRTQGGGCTTQAAPSGYVCYRLEGKPTAHSGYFFLMPQHSYWFSFWWNDSTGTVNGQPAGTMLLHVYTADGTPIQCATASGCTTLSASGTQAADVITNQTAILTAGDSGGLLNHITIGNNENGSNAGTTTYFQNAMMNFTTAPFPLFWTDSDPLVNVLAPARRVTWSQAGVVGGIPSATWAQCVTASCNTVVSNGASSTTAQINAALDSASANTYVLLPSGTYTAGASWRGDSNVVLRGQGANLTVMRPNAVAPGNGMGAGILINSGDANNSRGTISNPTGCSYTSNTSCAAVSVAVPVKGANTISLTTNCCTNLKVGNPLFLDQVDASTDIGGVFVNAMTSTYTGSFTTPGNAGPYSTQGSVSYGRGQTASGNGCSAPSACYSQQQVTVVTQCDGVTTLGHACTSGTNITISPALEMPNWTGTMTAWWATSPALNDGVEDLTIDVVNLQSTGACGNQAGACGVGVFNALNSWVKGVSVVNTGGEALTRVLLSEHTSVVNNYDFLNINSSTSSYGIEVVGSSDTLVENNIIQAVATPLQLNGPSSGTVFGYNYCINDWYTASLQYNIPSGGDHSAGESLTNREGNVCNGHTNDNVHGTGNLNLDFRNAFMGTQAACATNATVYASTTWGSCTQNYEPETILAYHRFASVIGNTLGTTGTHTTYQATAWSGATGFNVFVYQGTGNGLQSNTGTDTNTGASLIRWGNSDPVTGFSSPRFNCSELPTAWTSGTNIAPYDAARLSSPCPLTHTLPASAYYASKPAWFPISKPWPLVGPDVSGGNVIQCSSGTYTLALVTNVSQCAAGTGSVYASGTVNSNPAMDCYFSLGGLPDGTGAQLTNFNEATCYAPIGITAPPSPAPAMFAKSSVN